MVHYFTKYIVGLADSNGLCVPKTYIASVRNSLPAKYAGLRIGNRLSEASIADS